MKKVVEKIKSLVAIKTFDRDHFYWVGRERGNKQLFNFGLINLKEMVKHKNKLESCFRFSFKKTQP